MPNHDAPTPACRLIHGDCVHELRSIPSNSIDFALTDPPYLVRYRDRNGRSMANDDNDRWLYPAFTEVYWVLKSDSNAMSFYGWLRDELLNAEAFDGQHEAKMPAAKMVLRVQ